MCVQLILSRLTFPVAYWILDVIGTIVEGALFQPLCRSLNIESLAKQPKSGKESGEKTLILKFSYFGCLFQFLDWFW
jgi:hypothetical protein